MYIFYIFQGITLVSGILLLCCTAVQSDDISDIAPYTYKKPIPAHAEYVWRNIDRQKCRMYELLISIKKCPSTETSYNTENCS